jgi:hypothetical protein
MSTLDTKLPVIADLHHSQTNDEITSNLLPLIAMMLANEPDYLTWIGMGDIIDSNADTMGPWDDNIADLEAAFASGGITFRSLSDAHDTAAAGVAGTVYTSDLYVGEYWTLDIGDKWRVVALETLTTRIGYTISEDEILWLQGQLDLAVTDDKYLIIITHQDFWNDVTWPESSITPSSLAGDVTITSDTEDTFTEDDVGEVIMLRNVNDETGIESQYGYGTITAYNSGASIDVKTTHDFLNLSPTSKWMFLSDMYNTCITNSDYVRSIVENSSRVKLCLNGHWHKNTSHTINGIEYREVASCKSGSGTSNSMGPMTCAVLSLYTDGTWKIAGTGKQNSYNYHDYYVSDTGDIDNGGIYPEEAITPSMTSDDISGGDNISIISDIASDLFLLGEDGGRITIKPYLDEVSISGGIYGNFVDMSDIDAGIPSVLSVSNSIVKRSEVK